MMKNIFKLIVIFLPIYLVLCGCGGPADVTISSKDDTGCIARYYKVYWDNEDKGTISGCGKISFETEMDKTYELKYGASYVPSDYEWFEGDIRVDKRSLTIYIDGEGRMDFGLSKTANPVSP